MGQAFGDMGKGFRHTWWPKERVADHNFSETIQEKIPEGDDNLLSHSARSMVLMSSLGFNHRFFTIHVSSVLTNCKADDILAFIATYHIF